MIRSRSVFICAPPSCLYSAIVVILPQEPVEEVTLVRSIRIFSILSQVALPLETASFQQPPTSGIILAAVTFHPLSTQIIE
jgi:hypothetical protein